MFQGTGPGSPEYSSILTDLLQAAVAHPIATTAGAIGLLGSIASIISITNARRNKHIQDYLFQVAERNLQKELTDADIERKKQEATELGGRVLDLQRQIQKDIPAEAKRAVLRDRLDSHAAALAHTHRELLSTQAALQDLGEKRELPREILRAVEEQIQPKYLRRERISNLKTLLTVTSAAAAATSTLVPPPFGRYLGIPFLLATVPMIVILLRLSVSRGNFARSLLFPKRTIAAAFLTVVAAAVALLGLLQTRLHQREELFALAMLLGVCFALPAWLYTVLGYRRMRRPPKPPGVEVPPNTGAAQDG
jgi:hypothetical protein